MNDTFQRLAGLPGTGKRSVAKAIAATIGRPLMPFTSISSIDPASILLIEDLDREHLPLVRARARDLQSLTAWARHNATEAR